MSTVARLKEAIRARLPELRALSRWPVFKMFVGRARAILIGMTVHAVFISVLLEPLLKWIFPPPERKTGLAALFSSGPSGPPTHEKVLAWLGPILWVVGWALFGVFLERSIKPALERARQRSADLEAEAARRLARGDVLGGLTLLEEAAAVAPDDNVQQRLAATIVDVRATNAPGEVARTAVVVAPPSAVSGGRIELEGLLGEGAMGRVFAATDTLLGRRLAVKELAEGIAGNAEFRERFLREARVLARLSHPNIVQVFDLLDERGRHYLCMELVEGGSLESRLRDKGTFDVREAASVGRRIADALAYAHGKGVIHRDLKPGNVLLGEDGTVKVVDFGVARLVDQRMTRTGVIVGTPIYMAPEQIRGDETSEKSDMYSLGVLLYELVSGRPPFDGSLVALLAKHMTETPAKLDTDERYAAIVSALLAKDPAERPNASQALAELAQLEIALAA